MHTFPFVASTLYGNSAWKVRRLTPHATLLLVKIGSGLLHLHSATCLFHRLARKWPLAQRISSTCSKTPWPATHLTFVLVAQDRIERRFLARGRRPFSFCLRRPGFFFFCWESTEFCSPGSDVLPRRLCGIPGMVCHVRLPSSLLRLWSNGIRHRISLSRRRRRC